MPDKQPCPCGSTKTFSSCCSPYLDGSKRAATARTLMTSRYTAYVLKNGHYLLTSWHPSTRPEQINLDEQAATKWLRLKIIQSSNGGEDENEGIVEFIARYKINGKAQSLHEVSRFIKEQGLWFYVDGEIQQTDKP